MKNRVVARTINVKQVFYFFSRLVDDSRERKNWENSLSPKNRLRYRQTGAGGQINVIEVSNGSVWS